jgi:hypothetical protein
MTPIDQADMMNSTITTIRAGHPIECHMVRGSHPTDSPSWNNHTARFANIVLFFLLKNYQNLLVIRIT